MNDSTTNLYLLITLNCLLWLWSS